MVTQKDFVVCIMFKLQNASAFRVFVWLNIWLISDRWPLIQLVLTKLSSIVACSSLERLQAVGDLISYH